jgi:hypothetical protein
MRNNKKRLKRGEILVRGFKLIALTEKGEQAIKKIAVKKDNKASAIIETHNPYACTFLFKSRFAAFIPKKSVEFYIPDAMKDSGLSIEDYKFEVLE